MEYELFQINLKCVAINILLVKNISIKFEILYRNIGSVKDEGVMDNNEHEHRIDSVTLQIEGMDCTCNADLLARKLNALAGVRSHEINPVTGQARVAYDPATVSVQEIIRTVAETGMTASQVRGKGRKSTWWREPQQLALYGCGLIALIAFISGFLGVPILVTNGLYLLAVLVGVG